MKPKFIAWIALGAFVLIAAGWMWGASGKAAIELDRRGLEEGLEFTQAREAMLDGRVSLYLVNFGDASRHFDEARQHLEQAQLRLREGGQAERAGRLEVVLAHLRDAQRLSAALDSSAQNAAVAAFQALGPIESR